MENRALRKKPSFCFYRLLNAFSLATIIYARFGQISFGTASGYAEVIATLRTHHDDHVKPLAKLIWVASICTTVYAWWEMLTVAADRSQNANRPSLRGITHDLEPLEKGVEKDSQSEYGMETVA